MSKVESKTDWERVRREYDSDAPIPYDPEDGPYDPNDDAAVEAYWKAGPILRPNLRETVTLSLYKDALDRFRARGDNWEKQIDETLKQAVGL